MSLPEIVTREQWVEQPQGTARAEEKAMTRARDALNAERRSCRWCEIDKAYVFDGPAGRGDACSTCSRAAAS